MGDSGPRASRLAANDEAGASRSITPIVRVQTETFDLAALSREITAGRADIGAIVTFEGLCRDEGGTLAALEIEHYSGMADAEILRVAEEACRRWPLAGLIAVHRYGRIAPGDKIVGVVAASAHRAGAFAAADFLMDYLKTSAPFWKKEVFVDGTSGEWVAAKDTDDAAVERWSK